MYVRITGLKTGNIMSFVKFGHHFSKKGGAHVSKSSLLNDFKVAHDYNPRFPEEGTLDKELWNRAQIILRKHMKKGILVKFWANLALIWTSFKKGSYGSYQS